VLHERHNLSIPSWDIYSQKWDTWEKQKYPKKLKR
jgi:hypothetical protein